MKISQFGVAYAIRSHAMPKDICCIRASYEEAKKTANGLCCDDDDSQVWFTVDNDWYCVFYRDKNTGCFVVSKNEINLTKSYISDYF
jgi:hypothetical protein